MSRCVSVLQCLTVAFLLAACGGEAEEGEASQSQAASGAGEGHGTVEFDGVTYQIDHMNCRQGRWHASSDYIYFRVNAVDGVNQDWDRYNLTLTLNPSGERDGERENWLMVFGAKEWQAEATASDAGISGAGVIHPRDDANISSIDDERVKPIIFDMRC